MAAIFSFDSMLIILLLFICTSSYVRAAWPTGVQQHKAGGIIRNGAVIGDRLSPLVAVGCLGMAVFNLFFRA